jgi:hypothetical protein
MSTLLVIEWAEWIEPHSLQYVWSRSVHIDQPVTKVWLICNVCAS